LGDERIFGYELIDKILIWEWEIIEKGSHSGMESLAARLK